ncbi:multiple PDZ domain protein-like [Asterias rubens]|uniref:multiple PDZ domain protein-like n=1 Tax=Asterias rubens TaxID=7604 RepID=UPI00145540FA|nr:multiple PDZ domain protein-like [Asterias rubens]
MEDPAYVTMADIKNAKSAARKQDPPSSETDHYVCMSVIRASKKSSRRSTSPTIEDVYQDPHSIVSSEDNASDVDVPSCSGTSASARSSISGDKDDERLDLPVTRKVVVHPGPSGLGISIAGGVKSPIGLLPVLITDIDPGGLIESTGVIKVGDNIVSVNGETMEGKTHRDVVLAIKGSGSSLMLEVKECPENIRTYLSFDV